jgi:hypothetical protein
MIDVNSNAYLRLVRSGFFNPSPTPKRGKLKTAVKRRGIRPASVTPARGGSLMLPTNGMARPKLIPSPQARDVAWDQFVYLYNHMEEARGCNCPECLLFFQITDLLLARFQDPKQPRQESPEILPPSQPGLLEQVLATEEYLGNPEE